MQYQRLKTVVNIIFLILIIVIGVLGVIRLSKTVISLWKAFISIDEKLIAAILVPSGALMAAIITAALTHYYTKKREIAETHRDSQERNLYRLCTKGNSEISSRSQKGTDSTRN